jgi:hypothetical protein
VQSFFEHDDEPGPVTEDNRIREIRAVLDEAAHWTSETHPSAGDAKTLRRIRAILDSAPPAPRVLGPEHVYALSVARSAVLKAAGKFVAAADRYRKRDLVRSVQEMGDSERACVRVASFLADEIASARADRQHTEGTNP